LFLKNTYSQLNELFVIGYYSFSKLLLFDVLGKQSKVLMNCFGVNLIIYPVRNANMVRVVKLATEVNVN